MRLIVDNTANPALVQAARSFHGELRNRRAEQDFFAENALPMDLPDLYDGIAANDDEPWFDAAVRVGSRVWRMAFWVALGLCVGVLVL